MKKFILIDEMGSNLGFTRLSGRAEPDQRVVEEVPSKRGENVSTIGAIGLDGVRAALSVPGSVDGETMAFFAEEILAPQLNPGEIVFSEVHLALDQTSLTRRATRCVGKSVCFDNAARYFRLVYTLRLSSRTQMKTAILAVSKQLALSQAEAEELNVLWFTRKLSATDVLERADLLIEEK